jgi:hypothetical protein
MKKIFKLYISILLLAFCCLGADSLRVEDNAPAPISTDRLLAARQALHQSSELDHTRMRLGRRHANACGLLCFSAVIGTFMTVITSNFETGMDKETTLRISTPVMIVSTAALVPLYIVWREDIGYYWKNRKMHPAPESILNTYQRPHP